MVGAIHFSLLPGWSTDMMVESMDHFGIINEREKKKAAENETHESVVKALHDGPRVFFSLFT